MFRSFLGGTGATLDDARRRELRAHVLRREGQGKALSLLRAQRLSVQQHADVRSLLGSSSMLVAGGEADMVERHWLRQVTQEHLPMSRAVETLKTHASEWTKAWAWLRARLESRGRPQTLEALAQVPETVAAYLAKVFRQSKGRTATHRAAQAINFVLDLRGVSKLANAPLSAAVKRSADRQRKRPRKKAMVMCRHEVAQIVEQWGDRSQPAWKRWIALFVALACCTLARWADLKFPLSCVILPPQGAASVCMPKRKNRQTGEVFWASVPPSATCELLRDMLGTLGYSVTAEGVVDAPDNAYLFPALIHRQSSGRRKRAFWDAQPMFYALDKKQYGVYLRRYRQALRECCAMSKDEANLFSLHSGRRSGDTWLRQAGVPAEMRMAAGCWLDRDSEALYNDMADAEREALFAHIVV